MDSLPRPGGREGTEAHAGPRGASVRISCGREGGHGGGLYAAGTASWVHGRGLLSVRAARVDAQGFGYVRRTGP